MRRRAFGLALAALLVGCPATGDPAGPGSPSATATRGGTVTRGIRIAVVLPPAEDLAEAGVVAQDETVDGLASVMDREVAEIRRIRPDAPAFTRDLIALLASEGYDVVCAVGENAAAQVAAVAATHGGTRFCATPGPGPERLPDNVVVVDDRVEEAAAVLGVAAGASGLPVALVARSGTSGLGRWTKGLQDGVDRVARDSDGASPTPARDRVVVRVVEPGAAAAMARRLLDAGPRAIVTLSGADDVDVAEQVATRDRAAVLGLAATIGTGDEVLLALRHRLDVVLGAAIGHLLDRGSGGEHVDVGIADGAFDLVPGNHRRWRRVRAVVEEFLGAPADDPPA